jgi:hypothetical protein
MKKIYLLLLLSIFGVVIMGCGKDPISLIQNTTYEYDNSTTIKKAIDGSAFRGGKWDQYKDDRDRQFVRYTVTIPYKEFAKRTNGGFDYEAIIVEYIAQRIASIQYSIRGDYNRAAYEPTEENETIMNWYVDKIVPQLWEKNKVHKAEYFERNANNKQRLDNYEPLYKYWVFDDTNNPRLVTSDNKYTRYDYEEHLKYLPRDPSYPIPFGEVKDVTFTFGWALSNDMTEFEFLNGISEAKFHLTDGSFINYEHSFSAGSAIQLIYN